MADNGQKRCGECGRRLARRQAFNGAVYAAKWECPRCDRLRPDDADDDESNRLDDITRQYEEQNGG